LSVLEQHFGYHGVSIRKRLALRRRKSSRCEEQKKGTEEEAIFHKSELDHKLAAVFSPRVIEEVPELPAGYVFLHIAWIEMVEEVEYTKAGARLEMSIAQG
jgi:hypothetical protein